MADQNVYVVERRIYEKSEEHEVVAVFLAHRDATDVRDNLGGCGGRVVTTLLHDSIVDSEEEECKKHHWLPYNGKRFCLFCGVDDPNASPPN